MKNKINVTVIIPIHTHKVDNFDAYLTNAIQSIINNDVLPKSVIIVAPSGDTHNGETLIYVRELVRDKISKLEGYSELDVTIWGNMSGSYDFASQMNYAIINQLSILMGHTEWFSFLEFDDEYSNLWFRNVEKYMDEYPEVSIFLPIISDATPDRKFLGYTNEIAWAFEFTDKRGMIDADTLKDYPNFNPDGMVMRVADFVKIGGYKKNIKLAFNLEFLLRACDQGLPIMVIPKIGYQHVNMRPDSLFWTYKNSEDKLTPEESEFWMEQARKEFYYADDRPIVYDPTKNKTEQTDAK